MATTVAMPSPRQREDVYEAFTRLSESCDNLDRDAAITACKDGIRASKVILALSSRRESAADCEPRVTA